MKTAGVERRGDILDLADRVLKRHRAVQYMKAEKLVADRVKDWVPRRKHNRDALDALVALTDKDDEDEGNLSDDQMDE